MVKPVYNTLDDIQQRKDALLTDIQKAAKNKKYLKTRVIFSNFTYFACKSTK